MNNHNCICLTMSWSDVGNYEYKNASATYMNKFSTVFIITAINLTIVMSIAALIWPLFPNEVQSLAPDGTFQSSLELQTEISSNQNELPANHRVLPVDAEHKSKITIPHQALDPICVENMRENLVKFLKRVKSWKVRQGRQDDGDDDGDGEDAGGIAGVLGGLAEGNGALSVLSQLPAVVPQFVATLTQVSGAINQGLNGTDTPNLPSFIVKHGSELIQALTGHQSAPRPAPQQNYAERLPAPGGPPVRKPRPPVNYEYPPGYGPEDYPEELVKQPVQPTFAPFRPEDIGANRPRPGSYEPYPGNYYPETDNIQQQQQQHQQSQKPTSQLAELPNNIANNAEPAVDGQPSKSSLWQIYKDFRTKSPGNGSLTNFQLAHPAAFSNELLQSISQSISNHRGQPSNGLSSPSSGVSSAGAPSPPQSIPSSDISNTFNPDRPQQQLINTPNRPTLSVYKPSASNSNNGAAINSNNVGSASFQQSINNLNNNNNVESQNAPPPGYGPGPGPSNHEAVKQPVQETSHYQPTIQHLEFEPSNPGQQGQAPPPPTDSGSGLNGKPVYNIKNSLATTGSLAQLHAQQTQGLGGSGGAQFVKSPLSNILTTPIGPNGEYIPAISSLHEEDELKAVGPQTNSEDVKNGFTNKTPYTPVKNGVLLEAPRLTPPPQFALKPPSNLYIKPAPVEPPTTEEPNPPPEYSFQGSDKTGGGPSLIPPGATTIHRNQGNGNRSPLVSAAISSSFNSQLHQNPSGSGSFNSQLFKNPLGSSGVLPPSLLPENNHQFPQSEPIPTSEAPPPQNNEAEPEGDIPSPQKTNPSLISSSLTNIAENSAPYHPSSPNAAVGIPENSQYAPESTQQHQPQSPSNPLSQDTRLLQYLIINYPQLLGLNINPEAAANVPQSHQPESAVNNNEYYVETSTPPPQTIPETSTLAPAPLVVEETTQTPSKQQEIEIIPPSPAPTTESPPLSSSSNNKEKEAPPLPPPLPPQRKPILLPHLTASKPKPVGNKRPLPDVPQSTSEIKNNAALPTGIIGEGPILSSNWNIQGLAQTPGVKPTAPPDPYEQHNFQNVQSHFGGLLLGSLSSSNNNNPQPNLDNDKTPGGLNVNFASPIQFPSASAIQPPTPPVEVSSGESPEKENNETNFGDLSQLYGGNAPPQQPVQNFEETTSTPTSTPEPTPAIRTSTSSTFSVSVVEELPSLSFESFNLLQNQSNPDDNEPNTPPLPPALPGPTKKPSNFIPNVDLSAFQGPSVIGGYPAYVPISNNANTASEGLKLPVPSFGSSPPNTQAYQQQNSNQQFSIGNSAIAEMSKLPFFQEDTFRPSALPSFIIGGNKQKEEDSLEQVNSPDSVKPISEIFSVVTSTIKDDPLTETSSAEQPQIPNFPPGKPVYWMNMYYPNGLPVLTRVRSTTPEPTTPKPRRRKSTTTLGSTTTSAPEYYEESNEVVNKKVKRKKKVVNVDFVTD